MSNNRLMRLLSRWTARYYLKKPDQADLLQIKYPGFSDLYPALLNELCFRMGRPLSFRLTALNIELSSRCNLTCRHCLRQETHQRPELIDFRLFKKIVDACPHLKTLLPFQWGEPLLHPEIFDCIAYAARRNIRVMLTTNGTLLSEDVCRRLLEAGLTRLTVSFDGSLKSQADQRQVDSDQILAQVHLFRSIREKLASPCALDLSMVVDEKTEPHVEDFKGLFQGLADRLQLIPRFLAAPRLRPCRELWRGVLVVLSNGDVTLCCADAAGQAAFGNITRHSPEELFRCAALQSVRKAHARGYFPGICRECGEYASALVSPRFS